MNSNYIIMVIPVLCMLGLLLSIPVIIGVYVYRDATRRGMNAALWTLVAVFAPGFIGVIVYLLVRGGYEQYACPQCAAAVTDRYVVCPRCGAKLKETCPNCGFAAEPEWQVCPHCAAPLPESNGPRPVPVVKQDKTLGIILVVAIVLPLLLFLSIGVLSFINYSGSGSSGGVSAMSLMSSTHLTARDYAEHPAVMDWIAQCDREPEGVYALCFETEQGTQKATHYLVYAPSAGMTRADVRSNDGFLGRNENIEVRFDQSGYVEFAVNSESVSPDYAPDKVLVAASRFADNYAGLSVYINGERMNCAISNVSFDPTFVTPQ